MNYFDYFDLPVRFYTDKQQLRSRFLEKSKQLHPDFHTLADSPAREAAEDLSSLNNKAYQTLADDDARIRHILELHGLFSDEENYKMSPDFLVGVMDINENLMELEFDFNQGRYDATLSAIRALENDLNALIRPDLLAFDNGEMREATLVRVRDFYFKRRYLLRLKENLAKFAAA
ncbi:MAG: iron-sulfur cluster co-chaperone HscB C-terminal domain-containing protein [Saprospiraceae bacterium]|nr:iron-sulfur cluster co-chaperone HscB C-terminal domain-containing protein [Saprospiraceae bacterium]